jgi:uncharacterized membrane protein SpoIIM required for sporulation
MNVATLEQQIALMEERYSDGDRTRGDPKLRFRDEQFPADYRRLTHWLAMARRRHYPSDLIARLEHLVVAGHQSFYARGSGGFHPIDFIVGEFPRIVRGNAKLVLLSAALFFVPLFGMPFLVQQFPSLPYYFVDAETLDEMAANYSEFDSLTSQRTSGADVAMWGYYFFNNIGIDLRCFAWGAAFGIGAVFILLNNGLTLGAITGHIIAVGAGWHFLTFTCTHGAPELIGAVISGAAGMRLGFALLAPGPWSRAKALHEASREALLLLVGAVGLTIMAAFIEAFWSPNPAIPPPVKFGAAAVLWLSIPAYLLGAGRRGEVA